MKQPRPISPQSACAVKKIPQQFGADAQSNAVRLSNALALHQQGRLDQAEAIYKEILQSHPQHFDALQLLATVAVQRKQSVEAIELFDQVLKQNPDHAISFNNRGMALRDLKRHEESLESYDRALKIKPDYAEALNNRGIVLRDLNRDEEALQSYELALKFQPDYANALNNRGILLHDLKRHEEALESYQRALKIKPNYVEALYNRGILLHDLNLYEEALQSYDCALKISPDHAEVLNNRGATLMELKRVEDAFDSFNRAITIKPGYAEALRNHGNVLRDLNRQEEALESYGLALKIKPDYEFLYGTWLHTKMKICDWSNLENQLALLDEKVYQGVKVSPPFHVLALSSSRVIQKKVSETWVLAKYPINSALPKIIKRPKHDKIHIGYFSADFRTHAVSILMAELFELHDKSKFELTAFSFGADDNGELRNRIVAAFDNFIDVRNESDINVAVLARSLWVDIAVDLGGFTAKSRPGIFAFRAAPIQVGYLGYLGTMGAEYIDYLIADAMIVPDIHRGDYSEKIAYLPSYQANDRKRGIADKHFTRAELGLPQSGFVFCCFNNNYKITPGTFKSWMRILRQVEGSVLWLYQDNPKVASNLKREAEALGIASDRLVFAGRLSPPEYLARYRMADLFLDTLPYNAGTTASDALWAGLPVLTCIGETFAGRVAASLMNAIQLPELITLTMEDYEALAIELAMKPGRLSGLKQKLAENRLTAPLFDTQLFARHIEAVYAAMYERYQADLSPDHLLGS